MPAISGVFPAVEDRGVLGDGDPVRRLVECAQVGVLGPPVGVLELGPGDRERGAQLDQRDARAVAGRRGRQPAGPRPVFVRPRLVAECCHPWGPAKSTSLRAARAGVSRSRASSVDSTPARLGYRCVLAQQVAHEPACPQAADAERNASGERRAARGGVLDGLLLCLLAVLDDVAVLEQNPERDLAPERGTAQQELQIHAEVLELLPLGVAHDRPRLGVRLDRHALLVPADRLGLLGQRRAQPREGPGLARATLAAGSWYWSKPTAASCHANGRPDTRGTPPRRLESLTSERDRVTLGR